jgi:malic enzyme
LSGSPTTPSHALTIISSLRADFNSAIKNLCRHSSPDIFQGNTVITGLIKRYLIVCKINGFAISVLANPVPQTIAHSLKKLGQAAALHVVPRNHAPQQEKINDPTNAAQATCEQPDEPGDGVLGVKAMGTGETK